MDEAASEVLGRLEVVQEERMPPTLLQVSVPRPMNQV